jgi:hypothetical protein
VSALICKTVSCPYCGEPNDIELDPSGGASQSYEEDCQVCCRPWSVKVRISGQRASVSLSAQDETAEED